MEVLDKYFSFMYLFHCRNRFQNGGIDISEIVTMVNGFLSKSSKFCVV